MPLHERLGVKIGAYVDGAGLSDAINSENLRVAGEAVGMMQVSRLKGAFQAGGHHNHGGEAWTPLALKTMRAKTRAGKERMLVWTGRLAGSIQHAVSSTPTVLTVTVFTDTPYAIFHQYGAEHLPARPILLFTDSDIESIVRQLLVFLERQVNGDGGP
ncbi:MAG: hypothetical protein GY835_22545 [bacterium]|nr:hypothetical protein [bacterium]